MVCKSTKYSRKNYRILSVNWTQKEVHHFISRTEEIIEKILAAPLLFKQYKTDPKIRQAVVHETVILIYQVSVDGKTINLITFWGTVQNPKKLRLK